MSNVIPFARLRRLSGLSIVVVLVAWAGRAALAAEPPALADAILNAPSNRWTQIAADGGAGCFASGTVYMPPVNALISWGTRIHSAKFTRHEVCHIDIGKAGIVEALPPGKENWEPKGIGNWNFGTGGGFVTRDGLTLPVRVLSYEQLAWDAGGGRVVYYVGGNTFSYDPVTRQWQDLRPKNGPPLAVQGATMCYDAENRRVVLFGGFGVEVPYGEVGTWYFDCAKNEWSQPVFNAPLRAALDAARRLGVRARTLRRDAQYLMGLSGEEKAQAEKTIAVDLTALAPEIQKTLEPLARREEAWHKEDEARAETGTRHIQAAADAVKKAVNLDGLQRIAALEQAEDLLFYRAVDALRVEPPPRCNTDMVYDAKNKLVVLFGGDHLDMKLCDTWVLDTARNVWTQRRPKIMPPPQSAHSMAYLEPSGRVFLAGAEGNWTYDAKADVWQPVPDKTPRSSHAFRVAGVPGTDIVVGLATRKWGHSVSVHAYRLDPASASAKHASAQGSPRPPLPKTAHLSRKWYDNLPAPDPAAFAAKIAALPENKWTPLPGEKEIRARTWSSCIYDSRRRELIYWGGGHSGNVNGNVDHFSMRTGRWSRNLDSTFKPWPYGSMTACPNGRTYYDEPWTMHARKTYAYDPVSGLVAMAFVGGGGYYRLRDGKSGRYTWMYDPRSGAWADRIDTPFKCGYNGAAVTTPAGVMLLDEGQMWKLDAAARKWKKVGPRQKMGGGEYDTMVYDSKRERLIYLAGNIHYFPLKTAKWEKAKVGGIRSRDAVYVPSQDAVLAHVGSGTFKVLLCADEKIVNGPAGNFKGSSKGNSEHAVTMDPETETVLWIDAHGFCGPFTLKALKLNAETLPR